MQEPKSKYDYESKTIRSRSSLRCGLDRLETSDKQISANNSTRPRYLKKNPR